MDNDKNNLKRALRTNLESRLNCENWTICICSSILVRTSRNEDIQRITGYYYLPSDHFDGTIN